MNVFKQTLLGGLCVAAAQSSAHAQEIFGRWDPYTAPNIGHIQYYVSSSATVPGFGTPANPFQTIREALDIIDILHANPMTQPGTPAPIQITVNVAPGAYTAPAETFPMDLPANGVSIETWSDGTNAPDERAVIDSGGGEALRVAWVGAELLAPTVIQGLDVTGLPAIQVDPDLFDDPGAETLGVEIRDNFLAGGVGIDLWTRAGFTSLYVVENNDIGREAFKIITGIGGIALREECEAGASASTLYRSNRAQLYERILDIRNGGAPVAGDLPCAPRIFSNVFHFAEVIVSLNDCDSFLVNNTLAYAVNLGGNATPTGLEVSGGTLEHHNNILWSPDAPQPGPYLPSAPVDEVFVGVVFPNPPTTNIVFDLGTGPPAFASGDVLPVPFFAPMDLHLTPASIAAIGQGTNAMAIDPAVTVRSWQLPDVVAGGGALLTVRTDINLDNDLESRIHNSGQPVEAGPLAIDIGGDEHRDLLGVFARPARNGRIEFTDRAGMAPITQNELGNVLSNMAGPVGPGRTWTVELFLDGPPNGLFVLYGCFGYLEGIVDPLLGVPTQNGAVHQNLFIPAPALGSYALDVVSGMSLNLGGGTFDAAGVAMVPITFAMNDISNVETEVYFQMGTLDAAGRWGVSNRAKVELDDRP